MTPKSKGRSSSHELPTAAELAEAIARGDRRAEALLVDRYGPGLIYLLQREMEADLASDVYQESFRITIERLRKRRIENPDKLAGFLLGVARRLTKKSRRARRRTIEWFEDLDSLADPAPSPLDQAIRAEQRAIIRAAIQGLTVKRDRDLLTRYDLADEDKAALCAELGLQPAQFKRVIHRARVRLKRKVSGS